MSRNKTELSDAREREAALNPGKSFIVQAPAGSGKTGLLVQRYLHLLSVAERPESVVAMTFTRKAAGELKQRVIDALRGAGESRPVQDLYERRTRELAEAALAADRKSGWSILSNSSRLQIQTIDSLCAMLARQMPVISDFGGTHNVIEDASELYRAAVRRVIRDLSEGEKAHRDLFRRVSLHFDNDLSSLESQLALMLQKRDQWRGVTANNGNTLVDDFCQVLHFAHEALREVFREHSTVDFTEVTRAAIRALGTPEQPTDLLYWLDYRIEHLLIDEFQDTSRAQYDLIDALSAQWSEDDGHTLFLVGDPMQSIYRFREAEVALFQRSWSEQRLGSVRLNPLRLQTNFRATPEIVAWTQSLLAPVMAEDDPVSGAVKLERSIAARPLSKIVPQVVALIDDSGQAEAREIVRIIESAQEKGDVAVLVRSRAHVVSLLPAFRSAGISYEAVDLDELKAQQHVLDLLSLARAISHVADRVAWLACLRAPWCGLGVADLATLAENEPNRTILDLISDTEKLDRLSDEGRGRAAAIAAILSAAVANVGRTSLRELVERTWLALGGPAILREASQIQDAETFLSLLEQFDAGGIVRDFSLLKARLEFLYASPSAGTLKVRVMTIHQAKGLEFDTVIIPKLAAQVRSRENELLIWTDSVCEDGSTELRIAAQPRRGEKDPDYEFISAAIKQKDLHETERLLYVACTRAKNALYVLGNVASNKSGEGTCKPRSNTFLGMVWPSVESVFTAEFRRKVPVQANLFRDVVPAQLASPLRRLPLGWHAPKPAPSVHWSPELQQATASARTITYEWVSDTSRHAGTVVHALLKRIAKEGLPQWSYGRIKRMSPIFSSELLRLGVSRAEVAFAAEQVENALYRTIASERGQWILSPHLESRAEWPVGGRIRDQLISGTIDRMFRDEENRLWIIDYKTSEHAGSNLEHFLREEQRRYREQLENYGILISRIMHGPIWLGLYFPLLDSWREWPLEFGAVLTAGRSHSYTE